jgi:hypothetical protein
MKVLWQGCASSRAATYEGERRVERNGDAPLSKWCPGDGYDFTLTCRLCKRCGPAHAKRQELPISLPGLRRSDLVQQLGNAADPEAAVKFV